jgi:protein-S-isoprenylcysteine O-methyltransferase Ste14
MSSVMNEPRSRRAGWGWVVSTSVFATLWVYFFVDNLRAWAPAGRPVGLGPMELELVIAILYVVRRQPIAVSRARLAWTAAAIGVTGMLFARPAYDPVGGLEPLYMVLQLGGAATAVLSLLTLGRSFGIVAANRGLKTTGAYGIVRHPLYGAYLVTMAGYLLENPSVRNMIILGAVTAAQVIRITEEEKCLCADPEYRDYRRRVRFRLVPYLY